MPLPVITALCVMLSATNNGDSAAPYTGEAFPTLLSLRTRCQCPEELDSGLCCMGSVLRSSPGATVQSQVPQ